MSTPGGPDRPYDPAAPSPSTPADSPVYESPSFGSAPTYDPAAPYDPTPTYQPPSYEPPTYQPPTYGPPTYGAPTDQPAPPSEPYQPAAPYEPTPPAEPGYYLAPPPASALPPLPGEPYPPTSPPTSGYPAGPTGPRRTSQGAVIAVVLGVVVILALAVVGVGLALRAGGDRQLADPTGPTLPALPTFSTPTFSLPTPIPTGTPTGSTTSGPASPSSPTSTGPTDVSEVTVPAVTPGFQGALSPKENVVYDVPPGWEIRSPGTLVGYEDNDGKPVAVIHGVSTYRRDACPNVSGSNRGSAGFKTAGTLEPADAAQSGIQVFANAAALNPDGSSAPVTFGPVVDVQVAQGTIAAKMATATITPPADAECGAPTIAFTGVAFRTPSGATALFIMYLDRGTPDALPAAQAQQIIASLRPYTR